MGSTPRISRVTCTSRSRSWSGRIPVLNEDSVATSVSLGGDSGGKSSNSGRVFSEFTSRSGVFNDDLRKLCAAIARAMRECGPRPPGGLYVAACTLTARLGDDRGATVVGFLANARIE